MSQPFPEFIDSVEQLDEVLSRPDDALIAYMKDLEGDLMILGGGGKVGPTLARKAKRAVDACGRRRRIIAVDRFPLPELAAQGIETVECDMLDLAAIEKLPRCENIVYMVGRKFGSSGNESLTWAINVIVAYHAARTFTASRIAAFSTGCVYPVMDVRSGGATEATPPNPVGEYAMSCLGRERVFDHFSDTAGTKVVHVRLNYAVDLRYGVLYDIGQKVWAGQPVDVTTGYANVLWQGDVCSQVLRCLSLASAPSRAINLTGPETFAVRQVAQTFGRLMQREALITGTENGMGYLSNSLQAASVLGYPTVALGTILRWTAHWIMQGGANLGKPTHFETQDGKY